MKLINALSKLRWDSSDPERAPPPLPLNPGTPITTRPNTSAAIMSAANKLAENAKSAYTTNPSPSTSPDRSLIKGAAHRRMQSMQSGNVRDLRSYLDGMRSPERSPERPSSRADYDENYLSSPDRSPTRSNTPTPTAAPKDPFKDTPSLKPTRPSARPILGENTPPQSSTMLALQAMSARDMETPLREITNNPLGNGSLDGLSAQILNIATIATNLQKEMSQLSRRSKDNATDLISLKEATKTRDEDIRKSLRELVTSVQSSGSSTLLRSGGGGFGLGLLDNKAFTSPPSAGKSFALPRAASNNSFFDPERSPSPYSVEGASTISMLEKIIREMVTKEGQERLLSTLSDLTEKASKENTDAVKKIEDLAQFIKANSESQALVRSASGPPKLEMNLDHAGALSRSTPVFDGPEQRRGGDSLNADVMGLLQKVRDSVSTNGGMTAEVKGLVRDLRGEVLGMGRELGRKLDEVGVTHSNERSMEDSEQIKEDMQRIINGGLADLKDHMEKMVEEKNQQLALALPRDNNDDRELYAVVKHAIAEHSETLAQAQAQQPALDREGILDAVKEAYDEFKPEIELQQFGLERDEILQVLKEGLEDYQANREPPQAPSASKEEILDAMHQAMQSFTPPQPAVDMVDIKDEILTSVRVYLQELKSSSTADPETTRESVVEAVKEGLANHGPAAPREIEISRDDLFDAVKASLDGSTIPFGGFGEQVLHQVTDLMDQMRGEFKQYSAANGRDTEQVLDAVKDGLETLRAEIESYVDRAQDVTGKDEIVDVVKSGLEQLRADVQGYCAEGPTNGRNEMLDYIKAEFEHLHEAVASQASQVAPRAAEDGTGSAQSDILAALEAGFEGVKTQFAERDMEQETREEMMEAMKMEFDQIKDAIMTGSAAQKSEIIETIQESLDSLHNRITNPTLAAGDNEEALTGIKDELIHLREAIAGTLIRTGGGDKDEILEGVQQAVDSLRSQLTAEQSAASIAAVASLKEELEAFRESFNNQLVLPKAEQVDHDTAFNDIKARLEDMQNSNAGSAGVPTEMLEAFRGEFESIRQSIAQTHGSRADAEEVMDTVRLGLDDLRSHLEKKIDNPDRNISLNNEVIDALNEGLESLRTDITKSLDKPMDMTVNYEILDTLKEGIAGLRADMDKLAADSQSRRSATSDGNAMILAETPDAIDREITEEPAAPAEVPVANPLKRADFERVEVLLAQLQIKVEAMDHTVQEMPVPEPAHAAPAQPAEGVALKEDLIGMEEMLKEVQATLAIMAVKEAAEVENAVTKADTDAIETLLQNTKSRIEEIVLPNPATAVTKDNLDAVEAVVRSTNDAIEGLAAKMEESAATKGDVSVVQVLVEDLKAALEEAPTKADLDILGVLCTEIKTKIEEMVLPDPTELPSKADVEQLTGLIHDFRESHDKVKENYENDLAVTAKAFDDRRQEAEQIVEQITGVKTFLEESKEEILAKLAEGDSGIDALGEALKGMEEKLGGDPAAAADLKELVEIVNREFERAHESLEGIKVDHEQSAATMLEKHGEHKDAIVTQVVEKIDACFDGLMSKYDDAQQAAQEKAATMEEKAAQQEEILNNTKAMADELRLSIDTLGASLTTFTTTIPETLERVSEDSRIAFGRVDETFSKIEETHVKLDETQEGLKAEHQTTRDELAKIMEGVSGLQGDFTEYHPRFIVSLQEILALVQTHYEHSQKLAETAQEQARAVQDQIKAAAEESKAHSESIKAEAEGIKSQTEGLKAHFAEELENKFSANFSSLPALLPPPLEPSESVDKYDDSAVHEKLDKLMEHAELKYDDTAVHEKLDQLAARDDLPVQEKLDKLMEQITHSSDPSAQIERLDQIHQQVMTTAAEVTAFVSLQTKQIAEDHVNKEREAEEVALVLERRLAQKDVIEADITSLNEEKDSLRTAVEALRAEKEALAAQKARLNADVSALRMAVNIRREELHAMDAKADALERRILEGVMNHSRALLLTKTPKPSSKKPKGRDLRVPSDASAVTSSTIAPSAPPLQQSHALAMKTRPAFRRNGATPNSAERRIVSLSQINRNTVAAPAPYASVTPSLVSSIPGPLKRSHSVKSNALRKQSWGGRRNFSMTDDEGNKENETLAEEESEDELAPSERDDFESEMGTERRTSYEPTESGMTYGTGSYTDGITPSTDRRTSYGANSELTYGTGSYMTGSEIDRRSSLGSTIHGTLDGVEEEQEDEGGDAETVDGPEEGGPTQSEIEEAVQEVLAQDKADKVPYAPPSDSGLGTDLPTAALSASEMDYFNDT
ncbi:hypothetical protein H2203_003927 [Taxawa tesnikishii (nom. ined.)]|nr:hypothetical protein H2203_003927 [Dothideales sp. JES 119]